MDLGFPLGIRLTHAFNLVFVTLLIRSGIEILGGHPVEERNVREERLKRAHRVPPPSP